MPKIERGSELKIECEVCLQKYQNKTVMGTDIRLTFVFE